jgi:hypothetical protein
MIDDITFNYHGGNPRSIEAHDRTKHRKAADYTRILNLLKDFPGGLICDRIEVALNMPSNLQRALLGDEEKRLAGSLRPRRDAHRIKCRQTENRPATNQRR